MFSEFSIDRLDNDVLLVLETPTGQPFVDSVAAVLRLPSVSEGNVVLVVETTMGGTGVSLGEWLRNRRNSTAVSPSRISDT